MVDIDDTPENIKDLRLLFEAVLKQAGMPKTLLDVVRTEKTPVPIFVVLLVSFFTESTLVIVREDKDRSLVRSTHDTKGRSLDELPSFWCWEPPTTPPTDFHCVFITMTESVNHVFNLALLDQLQPNGLYITSANLLWKTSRVDSLLPHFNTVAEAVVFVNSEFETMSSSKTPSDKLIELYSKLESAYQSDISARRQMVQMRKFEF